LIIDRNAQREAAFQERWDTYGQPYEAAVIANGGTPWTAAESDPVRGAVRHSEGLLPTTRIDDTEETAA
jgi:hypothetical protein